MPSFNHVTLVGNLTRDPELKTTPKGTAICTFILAMNRKWKDDSGTEREEVTFVDVEAWNKAGETIAKYLNKGRALLVSGRLRQDSWADKVTGEKRSRLKVVCETFQFLDSRERATDSSAPPSAPDAATPVFKKEVDIDEDVPF